MFGASWRVGRVAGIEVRIDSSWAVIALLITYSMYLRFALVYERLAAGAAVALPVLAAVLFFGSVLVHGVPPTARRHFRCRPRSASSSSPSWPDGWWPAATGCDGS